MELKRVLCPVDITDMSRRALEYAAAVVTWYDGQLTVLHVVPTFDALEVHAGGLFEPVRILYPIRREEVIEELHRRVALTGVVSKDVALSVEEGDPAAIITEQSVQTNADLLVIGTHARHGINRLLLGSVADKVLRTAPCAVLTVPPSPGDDDSDISISSILCAVDFSTASLKAIGVAFDLARRTHARVTIVHAIDWVAEEHPLDELAPEYSAVRDGLTARAQDRLGTYIALHAHVDGGVTTRVVVGRAQVAVEEHADLIAIGAQGRGGASLALLGSTTEQVVRAAPCSVLTVRVSST